MKYRSSIRQIFALKKQTPLTSELSRVLEKKDEAKLVQLVKRVCFLKINNLRENLKSVFRMTPRGYNHAKIIFLT